MRAERVFNSFRVVGPRKMIAFHSIAVVFWWVVTVRSPSTNLWRLSWTWLRIGPYSCVERNGLNRATNGRRHYQGAVCCSKRPRHRRGAHRANPTASRTIRPLELSQAWVKPALDGPLECQRFCRTAVDQPPRQSTDKNQFRLDSLLYEWCQSICSTRKVKCIYLWLVVCYFGVDRSKHTAASAARNAQINAHVCFQSHSATEQRCVDRQMNWIAALARIIFMNDRTMVGDIVACCPPAWKDESLRANEGLFTLQIK